MQLAGKAGAQENPQRKVQAVPSLNGVSASEELENKTLGKVPLKSNLQPHPFHYLSRNSTGAHSLGPQSTDCLSKSSPSALILPVKYSLHTEREGNECSLCMFKDSFPFKVTEEIMFLQIPLGNAEDAGLYRSCSAAVRSLLHHSASHVNDLRG